MDRPAGAGLGPVRHHVAMPNLLAGLASLLWGTADFLGGLGVKGRSVLAFLTLTQLTGLTIVALLLVAFPADPSGTDLLIGVISGVLTVVLAGSLYRSLALGPMNVAAPLSAVVGAAVPVAYGLATGERPGVPAMLGIVVGLVGIVLVSTAKAQEQQRVAPLTLVLATTAGLMIGVVNILFAQTSEEGGLWPFAMTKLVAFVVVGIAFLVQRRRTGLRLGSPLLPVAAGGADAGATMSLLLALQRGSLILISILGGLFPVVTVVLARVVLKEPMTRWQLVGLAAAVVAVILLTI
jgi:drug/metabolite transporter (DMT)-like permease